MARRLPAGWMIGIRLPVTTASDEAWAQTHRAAGPWLVLAGLMPFATGVALLLFGRSIPEWSIVVSYAALTAFVLIGAARGVKAAQSVTGRMR